MFGLLKKKGIGSALDDCQKYHKKIGLEQELTDNQLATVKSMDLFKDVDSKHKTRGLTEYGGLAAFSAQFIGGVVSAMNNGNQLSDDAMDLTQKMAHVSVAIGVSIPELKLTTADMAYIESAGNITIEWAKKNPLMNEMEQLMKQNKEN